MSPTVITPRKTAPRLQLTEKYYLLIYVGERCGEWGKQLGSINEVTSQRLLRYNITFICPQPGNSVGPPLNQMHRQQLKLLLTTCYYRDTGGKRTRRARRTSFNTLHNWAIKHLPNQKEKGQERKGSMHSVPPPPTPHPHHNQHPLSLIT